MKLLFAVITMTGAGSALGQVIVSNAWVRATVEGQTATGAYMAIRSEADVSLVGASAEVAGHAAVHEMKMHGNMMMMMPVERLAIRAGHDLTLDERNYHLMLEDLRRQLRPGESVSLTLKFSDTKGALQEIHVAAAVRALASHGDSPEAMHDMHHD